MRPIFCFGMFCLTLICFSRQRVILPIRLADKDVFSHVVTVTIYPPTVCKAAVCKLVWLVILPVRGLYPNLLFDKDQEAGGMEGTGTCALQIKNDPK